MFISSETLRIVRLVAKYQNITAAADRINKVPSAISYTVKKLEEALGVTLFERRGSHICLTEAGEYFIAHSKNIIDDMDALQRNTLLVHEGIERELRIAVNNIIPQNVLVTLIQAFEEAFPTTQPVLQREVYNGCWDALYSKRVDLVIGAPHAVPYPEGIVSEPLGHMEWDFVLSPRHPLAHAATPLRTHDLRKYPAICIRDTSLNFSPQQAWLLDAQKPLFVPGFGVAIALIEAGTGIGYIPRHLAAGPVSAGRLVVRTVEEQKHATHLFLAWRPDGMGRVRQWCVDYLLHPERRWQLCGE
ncbi:DNA-binding transcriptional LysR family regulator [Silvimonas terrae]|uniref:DNA-binding transcriptional LysR family regulator n=1 Tax=Silvimonas terrae TaxID=300266 RepID=A0A840RLY8_9NEIS|nr:LysR substrate-binding domain-containing protein [Silvimonas terrae]MBB5193183.1 DNA-binding transcriptional LysR family regulator [Silvimonas terrae]